MFDKASQATSLFFSTVTRGHARRGRISIQECLNNCRVRLKVTKTTDAGGAQKVSYCFDSSVFTLH